MKWLSIIGVNEGGFGSWSNTAQRLFDQAEVLVSSERLFNLLDKDKRERIYWENDFSATLDQILKLRHQKVCILATGDPMFFGIGSTLSRHVSAQEIDVEPAPSVFSLICARLMWSQRDAVAVSLHGRELASLIRHLHPGAKIVVLSHDGQTPAKVARLLCDNGYSNSQLTVFEHLGGTLEKISTTSAAAFSLSDIPGFNSIALDCHCSQSKLPASRLPGLSDDYFEGDGVMTKKHIRALTISSLAPKPKDVLWDIGAGCGTIAIEWLRSVENTKAYAIEEKSERVNFIKQNAQNLGTPELDIIESAANQEILDSLAIPDAIFIGGGSSDFELIKYCWNKLKPSGRLVINSVSIDAEQNLIKALNEFGGELCHISLEHLQSLGQQQAWKPDRKISHYLVTKGTSC